jgi:hypothetical protein
MLLIVFTFNNNFYCSLFTCNSIHNLHNLNHSRTLNRQNMHENILCHSCTLYEYKAWGELEEIEIFLFIFPAPSHYYCHNASMWMKTRGDGEEDKKMVISL